VTVAGTIFFDLELLDLMKRGRQFGLTCFLRNNDSPTVSERIPVATGFFDIFVYDGSLNPDVEQARDFKFFANFAKAILDEDSASADEIHARLYLKTRRQRSDPWRNVKLSNGLTYYKTNEIVRNF
jgi:hypothetical protein